MQRRSTCLASCYLLQANLSQVYVNLLQIFPKVGFSDSISLSARAIVVCFFVFNVIFTIFVLLLLFIMLFLTYHGLSKCVGSIVLGCGGCGGIVSWTRASTAASISENKTGEAVTVEFPVVSVLETAVLGGTLVVTWVEIDIVSSSYSYSWVLGIPKMTQDPCLPHL